MFFTLMFKPNIYLWRSEALTSPASSEGRAYKCVMGFIFTWYFLHWWSNLIYIYEGRKSLLLRLSLRIGPTSVLWVSFLNEIHLVIWTKLKFATLIVFSYCKLLSFNMSFGSFHHCLKQVWVTKLRCVSVYNLFFHRRTLCVHILNHLTINVPDL